MSVWSDVAPIEVAGATHAELTCPMCGALIEWTPSHDESDGAQTAAVPDVYRCAEACGYEFCE